MRRWECDDHGNHFKSLQSGGDSAVMWFKIIIISYDYAVVLSLYFEERLQSYLKEKHREKVCETVWIGSKANTFIGGLHNSEAIAAVRFESRVDTSLIQAFHRIVMESAMRNVYLCV